MCVCQPVERVLRALAAILADDPTQVVVVDCEHWTNDVLSIVYVVRALAADMGWATG